MQNISIKITNHLFVTTGSMITTPSVLPEECLSSRICSTMLEWVAWQQL